MKGKLTEFAKVLDLRCEKWEEQPITLMGLLSETKRIKLLLTGMGKTFHGYCQILNSSPHDFSVGDSIQQSHWSLCSTDISQSTLHPITRFFPFWSIVWSYPVCLKSFNTSWVTAEEGTNSLLAWGPWISSARNFLPFLIQLNSFPIFLSLCNSYFLSGFKYGLFLPLANFPLVSKIHQT